MTYYSVVTVLVLVGLAKKRFGHYAILKNSSFRSPSNVLKCSLYVSHITVIILKSMSTDA